MIIACPSCQARYRFDETKLGDRPRARTRCAKCGAAIDIENPLRAEAGSPEPASAAKAAASPPPVAAGTAPAQQVKTSAMRSGVPSEDPSSGTLAGKDLHKMGLLDLPKDKRYSLAVIQGDATGQIFQITKTRTSLGRSGCDINLNDPEASRAHAELEILGEQAILRDLGSTNGTYVEQERIQHTLLANQMEFRIGGHSLMLIVTDVE